MALMCGPNVEHGLLIWNLEIVPRDSKITGLVGRVLSWSLTLVVAS